MPDGTALQNAFETRMRERGIVGESAASLRAAFRTRLRERGYSATDDYSDGQPMDEAVSEFDMVRPFREAAAAEEANPHTGDMSPARAIGMVGKTVAASQRMLSQADPTQNTVTGDIGRSLVKGITGTMSNLSGLVQAGGDALSGIMPATNPLTTGANALGQALAAGGAAAGAAADIATQDPALDVNPNYGFVGKTLMATAESTPNLVQQYAVGRLMPGVGFAATAAGPVFGQTYQDAIERHGDPGKAALEATASAAWTAITSKLQDKFGKVFGKAVGEKVAGAAAPALAKRLIDYGTQFIRKFGVEGIGEALQNEAEELGQRTLQQLVRGDKAAWSDYLETMPVRLASSALAGGLGGAADSAMEHWQNQAEARRKGAKPPPPAPGTQPPPTQPTPETPPSPPETAAPEPQVGDPDAVANAILSKLGVQVPQAAPTDATPNVAGATPDVASPGAPTEDDLLRSVGLDPARVRAPIDASRQQREADALDPSIERRRVREAELAAELEKLKQSPDWAEQERLHYERLAGGESPAQQRARENRTFLDEMMGIGSPGDNSGTQADIKDRSRRSELQSMPLDELRSLSERLTGFRTGARQALIGRVLDAEQSGATQGDRTDTANRMSETEARTTPSSSGGYTKAWGDMSRDELQDAARARNLPITGSKSSLAAMLEKNDAERTPETARGESPGTEQEQSHEEGHEKGRQEGLLSSENPPEESQSPAPAAGESVRSAETGTFNARRDDDVLRANGWTEEALNKLDEGAKRRYADKIRSDANEDGAVIRDGRAVLENMKPGDTIVDRFGDTWTLDPSGHLVSEGGNVVYPVFRATRGADGKIARGADGKAIKVFDPDLAAVRNASFTPASATVAKENPKTPPTLSIAGTEAEANPAPKFINEKGDEHAGPRFWHEDPTIAEAMQQAFETTNDEYDKLTDVPTEDRFRFVKAMRSELRDYGAFENNQHAIDYYLNQWRSGEQSPDLVVGTSADKESETATAPDYSSMPIPELRDLAKRRGVEPTGAKSVLVKRLQEADAKQPRVESEAPRSAPQSDSQSPGRDLPPEEVARNTAEAASTTDSRTRASTPPGSNQSGRALEGDASAEGTPKEPWQMTRAEYAKDMAVKSYVNSPVRSKNEVADYERYWARMHRDRVQEAFAEGKPVPPEVLADYPDLGKTRSEAEEPTPAIKSPDHSPDAGNKVESPSNTATASTAPTQQQAEELVAGMLGVDKIPPNVSVSIRQSTMPDKNGRVVAIDEWIIDVVVNNDKPTATKIKEAIKQRGYKSIGGYEHFARRDASWQFIAPGTEAAKAPASPAPTDYDAMTIDDLRALAKTRNVGHTGAKSVVIARLKALDAQKPSPDENAPRAIMTGKLAKWAEALPRPFAGKDSYGDNLWWQEADARLKKMGGYFDEDNANVLPENEPYDEIIRSLRDQIDAGDLEGARKRFDELTYSGPTLYPKEESEEAEAPSEPKASEPAAKPEQKPAEDVDRVPAVMELWKSESARINPDTPIVERAVRTVAGKILDAINSGVFHDILRPDNKVSRSVFQKLTGVKLPKTLKDTQALFTGKPFTMVESGPAATDTAAAEGQGAAALAGKLRARIKTAEESTLPGLLAVILNGGSAAVSEEAASVRAIKVRDQIDLDNKMLAKLEDAPTIESIESPGVASQRYAAGDFVKADGIDDLQVVVQVHPHGALTLASPAAWKAHGIGAGGRRVTLKVNGDNVRIIGRMGAVSGAGNSNANQTAAPKVGDTIAWESKGETYTGKVYGEGGGDLWVEITSAEPESVAGSMVGQKVAINASMTTGGFKVVGSDSGTKPAAKAPRPESKATPAASVLSPERQARKAELEKRLRDKIQNRLTMGFDPIMLAEATELASIYIEEGAKKFAAFARQMVGTLGDAVRPYLKSLYNGARDLPGMEEHADGMDAAADVSKLKTADIDAMLADQGEDHADVQNEGGKGRDAAGGKSVLPGSSGTDQNDSEAGRDDAGEGESLAPGASAGDGKPEREGGTEGNAAGGVKAGGRGSRSRGGTRTGKRGGVQPRTEADGTPAEPGPVGENPKVHDLDAPAATDVRDLNHRIGPDDVIAPPTQAGKIKGNIKAIRTLKLLEKEDRNPTPEEKKVLAQYVGFGPIGEVVNRLKAEIWERHLQRLQDYKDGKSYYEPSPPPDDVQSWAKNYYEDYKTIREMVDRSEFEAITKSTRNAHYTGKNVIEHGIWPAVMRLGFTGGNVLETSAGIGHMIGLMPDELAPTSKWTAVELDSISARILAKLYPQANVLHSSFQDAPLKKHVFDLIVGNVPFASDKVKTDEGYPPFSLHNYFLAKSIDMLRPGGLMVAISSISSMDADASRAWREWMAERADLVGAIRLPNNAFIKSANTAVTTDMLIFRKKQQGHPLEKVQDFAYTVQLDTKEKGKQGGKLEPIPLNVYYQNNPDMLLGKMSAKGEMYGGINEDKSEPTMDPTPGPLDEKIDAAIQMLPSDVLRLTGRETTDVVHSAPGTRMYSLFTDKSGNVMRRTPDGSVVLTGADAKAAKAFMGLRDAMTGVVSLQVNERTADADLEKARKALKDQYEQFVDKYGRINEKKSSIPDFVEDDPDFNKVAALEMVTYKGVQRGTTKSGKPRYVLLPIITPADILTKRTQWPFKEPETADSPRDAIAISEFFRGSLDLPYVASLLGKSESDARKAILAERLVFLDPSSGELVPSSAYLSGNIKAKLAAAEKAAQDDATYSLNVEALKPLVPQPKPISKINMRMGATWIPAEAYTAFVESLFGKGTVSIIKTSTGQWSVRPMTHAADADGRINLSRYGKHEFNGLDIVKHILEVDPLIAYDTEQTESGGTSRRKNPERSADAESMADAIRERFVEWAKTSDMAASIADAYNERYNASLPRKYEPPPYKHFPGASQSITLRDYQKRGIMRGVAGSYLNAAEVGLGKTFIGISTAMEWRRLKQARKPLLVVQPATLMQVSTAFNQLYPTANVLVPTEAERKKENWPRLINRITTGDWDCIVIPQTLFNNIRTSPAFAESFIHGEIDALTSAAADAVENDGTRSTTAKKLQEQIDSLEKYLDDIRQAANEDKGALFLDQLGIDGLIVDEAHDYKNSYFRTAYTQLKGVNPNASGRALDMLLKTKYVQQRVGMGRNIVLMTGTPVSNTIGEAWVMMRYVRPDLLEANHLANFDDFAGAFADISAKEEMDATNRFKPQLRMRAFTNTTQFQSIWLDIVDSVRYDNLPEAERKTINRPGIRGGKPTMIEMQPTKDTLRFMRALIARYEWFEKLRGKARFQNRHVPGVINTRARKVSIDPRMLDASLPDDPGSKVNRLVSEVYDRWKAGEEHQTAQVIFSDLYRDDPDNPRFNVFEDIQAKLIARGVPASEIVIATDLTDAGRAAVFERVNSGSVRVIMGTTQKLGIGVNIQQRLAALHHLDAPYRPMDMEQREGRIIRFGNLVPMLTGQDPEILRYGVKKTFDAGQYGRLERKQRAVNDTLAGNAVDDTVEGAGEETALSFAEASAAFSGDPDVLRKVELDGDIRRLEGLRASFVDARETTVRRIESAREWKKYNLKQAADAEAWVKKNGAVLDLDTAEYEVPGTSGKQTGKDAKEALKKWFTGTLERTKTRGEEGSAPRVRESGGVLRINGLYFETTSYADLSGDGGYDPSHSGISASLDGHGTGTYRTPAGLLARIKEWWDGVNDKIETGKAGAARNEQEAVAAEEALKKLKFDHQDELDALKAERDKVMARLRVKKEAEQTAGDDDFDPNDPHAGEMADVDPLDDGGGDFRSRTGSGGASGGNPGIAQRAIDTLQGWADDAYRRIRARQLPRGRNVGGTILFDELWDHAIVASVRAVTAGIKGGQKLTGVIKKVIADFGNRESVQSEAAQRQIRSLAKAMIADAKGKPENLERTLTRFQQSRSVGFKPADIRKLVMKQTGQTADADAKALNVELTKAEKAAARAYAAGMRDAVSDIQRMIPGFIRDIRAGRRAERAINDFETRAAVDAAREGQKPGVYSGTTSPVDTTPTGERMRQKVADGIRSEMVRLLEENVPQSLRSKYLAAVKNTRTPAMLVGQLNRMRRDFVRWQARQYAAQARNIINAAKGKFKALEPELEREALRAAMVLKRGLVHIRERGLSMEDIVATRDSIRDAANTVVGAFHQQNTLDDVMVRGEKIDTEAARKGIIDGLGGKDDLPAASLPTDREAPVLTRIIRNRTNWEQLARMIDGFKAGGAAVRLFKAALTARRKTLAMHHAFVDAFGEIVTKAGYKSLGDFLAQVSGVLGPARQKVYNVQFGPYMKLTLGQMGYIYASMGDEGFMARVLPKRMPDGSVKPGQALQFRDAPNDPEFHVTEADLIRVAQALPKPVRQIIDAAKALYDRTYFDAMSRVNKRMKGYFLTKVPGYFGIKLNRKASETRGTPTNWKGAWTKAWEESGFMQERQGAGSSPISIGDFGTDIMLRSNAASHVVNKSETVKALVRVLLHKSVTQAISRKLGASTVERLERRIALWSGGDLNVTNDRLFRRILSTWARSKTQLWAWTWARNAVGSVKLLNYIGAKAFAQGLTGLTPAVYHDLRTYSPELRERWDGGGMGAFHTGLEHVAHAGVQDAAKATLRNLVMAAKSAASVGMVDARAALSGADKSWNAMLDAMTVGNFFDAIPAMIAYQSFLKRAPKGLDATQRKRWAAAHATRVFEQVANTSGTEYANDIQLEARDSVLLASFIPFTGDTAKTQSMLYEAWSKSPKKAIRAALVLGLSSLLSALVAALQAGSKGDSTEDVARSAVRRAAQEVLSIVPGGSQIPPLVAQVISGKRADSSVLDTAFGDIGKQIVGVLADVGSAYDRMDKPEKINTLTAVQKLGRATLEALDLSDNVTGLPIGQYMRYTSKAIENWTKD